MAGFAGHDRPLIISALPMENGPVGNPTARADVAVNRPEGEGWRPAQRRALRPGGVG